MSCIKSISQNFHAFWRQHFAEHSLCLKARIQYTIVIRPEMRGRIYWTMVSIDTLVSIGAANASLARKISRSVFGEPIRTSNCALEWSRCILVL